MNAPLPPGILALPAEIRRARPLLGTFVEIAAQGEDAQETEEAIARAFNSVEMVQALMSYHDPDSEVSRINRSAGEPVPVSGHTWRVLAAAREFAAASGGLFDVSIAPTLARLGYLPLHAGFAKPSGQGDWRHVELLPGRKVRLARRLHIDLGGIAKGYAVDVALRALSQSGMRAGQVNAGGDLRAFGPAAQTVQVRHPREAPRTLPLLRLEDGAVATSATYFAARKRQGRWVTPLIHPHTRTPCGGERSVSVLAPDCMTADALTKIVHADAERALAVLARYRARALVLEPDAVPGMLRFSFFEPDADSEPRWQVQVRPEADHA